MEYLTYLTLHGEKVFSNGTQSNHFAENLENLLRLRRYLKTFVPLESKVSLVFQLCAVSAAKTKKKEIVEWERLNCYIISIA